MNDPKQTYFSLTYDLSTLSSSSVTNLRIYRRANRGSAGTGTGEALYYGLGRWEYKDISSPSTSGPVTINLRAPIDWQEFLSTGSGLNTAIPWTLTVSGTPTNYKVLTSPILTWTDVIVVLTTASAGVSPKGMLMPKDLNNTATVVNLSDYNNLTSGYSRNLSEARPFVSSGLYSLTPRGVYTLPSGVY
jgi:hypothetical protein